jgi:hypothetical protein
MSDVTQILSAIEQGDGQAAEKLLPLVTWAKRGPVEDRSTNDETELTDEDQLDVLAQLPCQTGTVFRFRPEKCTSCTSCTFPGDVLRKKSRTVPRRVRSTRPLAAPARAATGTQR